MTKLALAKKYIKKWQSKLRLNDWKIAVKILKTDKFYKVIQEVGEPSVSLAEVESTAAATNVGSIHDVNNQPNIFNREAAILIHDRGDLDAENIESYVVHEMLHIFLCYIVPYQSDLEVTKVEQAVVTLEELLTGHKDK